MAEVDSPVDNFTTATSSLTAAIFGSDFYIHHLSFEQGDDPRQASMGVIPANKPLVPREQHLP